jgi:hypothetical protein
LADIHGVSANAISFERKYAAVTGRKLDLYPASDARKYSLLLRLIHRSSSYELTLTKRECFGLRVS